MTSRIEKSLRNIKFGLLSQISILFLNLIVRSVFIRFLSIDYLGINEVFHNILSILNLAEMGFGTAIIYHFYEPLANNDEDKLNSLMSLYKKVYYCIGIFIFITGSLLIPFLPFFINDIVDIPELSLIFIMFVIESSARYFFVYKQTFISVNQNEHIISKYNLITNVAIKSLQLFFLLMTRNFIFYLVIQLFGNLVLNLLLSKKADKLYPYLKSKKNAPIAYLEKKKIYRNIKAMLMHKIGGLLSNGIDILLLSYFVNLAIVGLYSNYLMILKSFLMIISILFKSITASVGNFVATNPKKEIFNQFRIINFINFWLHAIVSICLLILFDDFITVWLGVEFLLPPLLVKIIVINFYLTGMRRSIWVFSDSLGLFWHDRYLPFFSTTIKLISTFLLINIFGAMGIFLGTTLSLLLSSFWFEPFILFKFGFEKQQKIYFGDYFLKVFVFLANYLIIHRLVLFINVTGFLSFFFSSVLVFIISNLILIFFYHKSSEFHYVVKILLGKHRTNMVDSKNRE